MLRLIHTADWHLGQRYHGQERHAEHRAFLTWLLDTLVERRADVLLVAGDVFDVVNPSLQAQALLYDFIVSAHERLPRLDLMMIAGNHDSGNRIELPAPLMRRLRTHAVGRVNWLDELARAEAELAPLEKALQDGRLTLTRLETRRDELDKALAGLDDATLARLLAQPDDETRRQEQAVNDAEQARQQADATLAELRQALLAHRRGQALTGDETNDDTLLSDTVQDEIRRRHEALTVEREALAPQLDTAQRHRDEALQALSDDDRKRERRKAGQSELEAAQAEYLRWGQISELIGSADGKVFRRIAQAYILEQLLEHANVHLAGLSRRYRLVRGGSPLGSTGGRR